MVAFHHDVDVLQPAVPSGRFGDASQSVTMRADPFHEQGYLFEVTEGVGGRAADAVVEQQRAAPAGGGDDARPPIVRRDQGGLGGGERQVIVTRSEAAVHPQRSRYADRHLDGADAVLDVASVVWKIAARALVEQGVSSARRGVEVAPATLDRGLGDRTVVAGGCER